MNDFIAHFGIQGMKWGIRRYQNYDGTLTEAGKARLRKELKDVHGMYHPKFGKKQDPASRRLYKNPVIAKERERLVVKRKELDDAVEAKKKAANEWAKDKDSVKKAIRKMVDGFSDESKEDLMLDDQLAGSTYEEKINNYVNDLVDTIKSDSYIANNYFYYTPEGKKRSEDISRKWKTYEKEVSKAADRIIKELGDLDVTIAFDDNFPDNAKNRREAQRLENSLGWYSIRDILEEQPEEYYKNRKG